MEPALIDLYSELRRWGAVAGATAWFNPDAMLNGDATMGGRGGSHGMVQP